jgi:hypothetical protein
MDYSENFLTQDHIEKLIELPFINFHGMLDRYIYLKCLILGREGEITYVDGYFVIGSTEYYYDDYGREHIDEDYLLTEPDSPEIVVSVKVTEFSNKDDLLGEEVNLISSQGIDEILYSYKQLGELMNKLGCPEPKPLMELSKKEYAYDIKLVNQKSNFSLSDASKIAANVYKTSIRGNLQQQYMPNTMALMDHYLELLSDCIKGTNQHGFKLHTVELWCFEDDKYGESTSYSYDNGTYLNQKATLDSKLTIISKREFVRWCEYENVDTGLYYHQKDTDESVEALLLKNEKLKKQIDEQNMEIIDLKWIESPKGKSDNSFPPELQLSIDAFEQLCLGQKTLPTNEKIKEWLTKESKGRGITHKDGSTELKGLSDVKLKTIPSIIKS